jgi:hypothetical protein
MVKLLTERARGRSPHVKLSMHPFVELGLAHSLPLTTMARSRF